MQLPEALATNEKYLKNLMDGIAPDIGEVLFALPGRIIHDLNRHCLLPLFTRAAKRQLSHKSNLAKFKKALTEVKKEACKHVIDNAQSKTDELHSRDPLSKDMSYIPIKIVVSPMDPEYTQMRVAWVEALVSEEVDLQKTEDWAVYQTFTFTADIPALPSRFDRKK